MVAATSVVQSHGVLQNLADKLLAADTTLPEKYRVLFSLRNLPGEQAREVLANGTLYAVCVCGACTHASMVHPLHAAADGLMALVQP
jgi:hypothetical protein